jgi:group I intron endonuclease
VIFDFRSYNIPVNFRLNARETYGTEAAMADVTPTRVSGIYQIRNTLNGKIYVGSAVSIAARWRVHLCQLRSGDHHSVKLQRSWNKHGESAFAFEVLELVPNKLDLISIEQHHLNRTQSFDPKFGYNVSPTAGSSLGTKASDETRRKQSKVQSERWTPEERRKASERFKEIASRPEVKAKKAARKLGPEVNAKISASISKYLSDPKVREALSQKVKGFKHTPEARAKISEALRNRSPDTIENIASQLRGRKRPPEAMANARKARIGSKHTPESIAKMSESMKLVHKIKRERSSASQSPLSFTHQIETPSVHRPTRQLHLFPVEESASPS